MPSNTPFIVREATVQQIQVVCDKTCPAWWNGGSDSFFARYGSTYLRNATTARCTEADDVETCTWGHSSGSAAAALAQLTEECTCGAHYHKAV